jgi:hypothetical protein
VEEGELWSELGGEAVRQEGNESMLRSGNEMRVAADDTDSPGNRVARAKVVVLEEAVASNRTRNRLGCRV